MLSSSGLTLPHDTRESSTRKTFEDICDLRKQENCEENKRWSAISEKKRRDRVSWSKSAVQSLYKPNPLGKDRDHKRQYITKPEDENWAMGSGSIQYTPHGVQSRNEMPTPHKPQIKLHADRSGGKECTTYFKDVQGRNVTCHGTSRAAANNNVLSLSVQGKAMQKRSSNMQGASASQIGENGVNRTAAAEKVSVAAVAPPSARKPVLPSHTRSHRPLTADMVRTDHAPLHKEYIHRPAITVLDSFTIPIYSCFSEDKVFHPEYDKVLTKKRERQHAQKLASIEKKKLEVEQHIALRQGIETVYQRIRVRGKPTSARREFVPPKPGSSSTGIVPEECIREDDEEVGIQEDEEEYDDAALRGVSKPGPYTAGSVNTMTLKEADAHAVDFKRSSDVVSRAHARPRTASTALEHQKRLSAISLAADAMLQGSTPRSRSELEVAVKLGSEAGSCVGREQSAQTGGTAPPSERGSRSPSNEHVVAGEPAVVVAQRAPRPVVPSFHKVPIGVTPKRPASARVTSAKTRSTGNYLKVQLQAPTGVAEDPTPEHRCISSPRRPQSARPACDGNQAITLGVCRSSVASMTLV